VTVLDQEPERQNILAANAWAFARRGKPVDEPFGRILHRRMLGQVWRWAGSYRASDKNIGVPYWEAPVKLRDALKAARYWIDHTSFPPDEIAVRFHHALVWIHLFPNGNGRWSRLMAYLLVVSLGQPRLTWGGTDSVKQTKFVGITSSGCARPTLMTSMP